MTKRNVMLELWRDTSFYMIAPMWLAAIVLFFADTHPVDATNTLRFGLVVLFLLPAFSNLLLTAVLSAKRTTDAAAEAKLVNFGTLVGTMPAALALPLEYYWPVWVMAALVVLNHGVLVVYFRYINPDRRMVSVDTGSYDGEGERAAGDAGMSYPAERAGHSLDALAGMHDLKEQLLAAATEAKKAASRKGKKNDLTANMRNGILLYGEPGNGKTAIVEGLAGSMKLPIIKMSFGGIGSKWVNSTTENVVTLFKDARAQAPCLLFMDEVDSVITSRDNIANSTEEGPKITNQILTELVNTRGSGVIMVMATNYLDRLDKAAIREGRVDFKLLVPPPDAEARAAIIENAANRAHGSVMLLDEAIEQAAKRWEGFSAARINAVVTEAVRIAVKDGFVDIDYDDLQSAMRTMQGKLGDRISEDTPTLDTLHMPAAQKKALLGIAKRMTNIEQIEAMGGSVPNGVLMAGPPGTGKTLTVRALAKTVEWPLFTTTGATLMNNEKAVDDLVGKAKNARPCIVFIDEADDVFADRRTQSAFAASITNKLLTAMDGAGGKVHDVLWMAAVNAPETMDAAAMRGGRFTEKVWFANPDADTAEQIIAQWMNRSKAQFNESLTANALAGMLSGVSPANIQAVLQTAVNVMIARATAEDGPQRVIDRDVREAMSTVL